VELDVLDRPKTPQAPEPPLPREPILPPTLPFPFFPTFPAAPGLIPHPLFPRYPVSLGRNGPGLHPTMPNVALPPRFINPPIKSEEFSLTKSKSVEREKSLTPSSVESTTSSIQIENEKVEKEKVDNKLTKVFKSNKELNFMKVPERVSPAGGTPSIMSTPVAPITLATPIPTVQMPSLKNSKADKTEKNDMVNSIESILLDLIYIFVICIFSEKYY